MEIGSAARAPKRWLVRVEARSEGAALYVNGLSTVEALRLLPPSAKIEVQHLFGEIGYGRQPSRSISRADLPPRSTVEDIVRVLLAHEDLTLIDFDARIAGNVTLSTHDDGEATFYVSDFGEAAKLLDAATGSELSAAQRAAALDHPGRYVLFEGEEMSVFATFDDVLASGALRGR